MTCSRQGYHPCSCSLTLASSLYDCAYNTTPLLLVHNNHCSPLETQVTIYKSQKTCLGVSSMATFSQTQYTDPSPKFHFVGVLQTFIALIYHYQHNLLAL
jgi:hypothetical protein